MAKDVIDTGKVKIGLAYEKRAAPEMGTDALRLQRALLGEKEPIDKDGIAISVATVLVFFLVVAPAFIRG